LRAKNLWVHTSIPVSKTLDYITILGRFTISSIVDIILGLPSPEERRRRRAYGILRSGFIFAISHKEPLQFITLTTWARRKTQDLMKDWKEFVKRVRRSCEFCNIYWDVSLYFEYCLIRTKEGRGVLHVISKGVRLQESWVSKTWKRIHGAYVVKVIDIFGFSPYLINYLTSYLAGQANQRSAWSKRWLFNGWRTTFKSLIKEHGFTEGLKYWDVLIRYYKEKTQILERIDAYVTSNKG
jgi:hypothetical protein